MFNRNHSSAPVHDSISDAERLEVDETQGDYSYLASTFSGFLNSASSRSFTAILARPDGAEVRSSGD